MFLTISIGLLAEQLLVNFYRDSLKHSISRCIQMTSTPDPLVQALSQRYVGVAPEALMAVMCPLLIPIHELDKTVTKNVGQSHYRATFRIKITEQNETVIQVGRTGKFVPSSYLNGGTWSEIVKGRIVSVDTQAGIAEGEIYTGENSKKSLIDALSNLLEADYWEVDQYGASAKILSALAEL